MNSRKDDGIEVVLFAHAQGNFLGGSIASILRSAAYAEARGIIVTLTAVLYAPTPLTLKTAESKLDARWRMLDVPNASLHQARNAARIAVRQQFAAFVDGYDLWCETWLYAAYLAVGERRAVWRPELLLTFGNDFHRSPGYSAVFQPVHLLKPAVLMANDQLPSGFVAPRTVLETHAWPCADDERGWQGVDRWWSCEVAASGYEHRAIESTFHYRRRPDALFATPRRPANLGEERIGPTRLALPQTSQRAFAVRGLVDEDVA
jgi:hypothetical protein